MDATVTANDIEQGRRAGHEWAVRRATKDQLVQLYAYHLTAGPGRLDARFQDLVPTICGLGWEAAERVRRDDGFAFGFAEAAVQFWRELWMTL